MDGEEWWVKGGCQSCVMRGLGEEGEGWKVRGGGWRVSGGGLRSGG